jgi:predicted component of type VI protein secretion system
MSLTLTLRNAEAAPEGMEREFKVAGETALIGRSRNCDWHLPDAKNIVSSRHAESTMASRRASPSSERANRPSRSPTYGSAPAR